MANTRLPVFSAVMLATLVLISYQPNFRIGFYLDDYIYLERAGRTDWSNALAQIFDPRTQVVWYRPSQSIQFFLQAQFFGNNPNAYHLVNTIYHVINVWLIYGILWRISRRWLIGFVAALFYATFGVYISGVNWIGIVDPLATVFYLFSIWFWWSFLEKENARDYWLAFGAFVLALLSKQTAVTIPIALFLLDRWFAGKSISLSNLIRRYIGFGVAAIIFVLVQATAPTTSTFTSVFGWQLGATMLWILFQYLVLFFFPWGLYPSIDLNPTDVGTPLTYVWFFLCAIIFLVVLWRTHSRVLLFLAIFTLMTLIPVLPFPFLEHRYLYLPIIASAILFALVFQKLFARLNVHRWFAPGAALGFALIALANGIWLEESAIGAAEWARQLRVPFRDIERQHATFPPNTLLYFIDPITPTTGGLSGMFFMRYGRDVYVRNWSESARLRDHNAAFVYYFDAERKPREIAVDKNITLTTSPGMPAQFSAPIVLEGFEIAQTTIKRGTPIVLILYWRAREKIETDYTFFAHLVATDGKIVAQYDAPPRKGQIPTSAWQANRLIADAVVIATDNVPIGAEYKLQFGLYDANTQQRLSIANSQVDSIVIESFRVIE